MSDTVPRGYEAYARVFHKPELEFWDEWMDAPNMWWPQDRAWFVETDIDEDTTCVAGSKQAIDAVLSHPALEALPVGEDDRIDTDGDVLNAAGRL